MTTFDAATLEGVHRLEVSPRKGFIRPCQLVVVRQPQKPPELAVATADRPSGNGWIVFTVLGLAVLFRIGLLAHVAAQMVMHSLTWLPLTLDGDAWYFDRSVLVLLAIAAFAVYGFLAALGGRPAFGVMKPGSLVGQYLAFGCLLVVAGLITAGPPSLLRSFGALGLRIELYSPVAEHTCFPEPCPPTPHRTCTALTFSLHQS